MASTAASSDISPSSPSLETRPQAGPLPQKRGEIGFRQSFREEHVRVAEESDTRATEPDARPARHPADRDFAPASNATLQTDPPPASIPTPSPPPANTTAASTKSPKSRILRILGTRINGIPVISLCRFFFQIVLFGATLAAWIVVTKHLAHSSAPPPPQDQNTSSDDSSNNDSDNGLLSITGSGNIFVHVAFGVAVLGQLLFLERCVFFIRAQRYAFYHPGLPMHGRNGSTGLGSMAFAPWHRPSLPSYAATLAQSGYGTGDVEDNAIAIPPPPAYGNTRGSTLLLANFLSNSLRRSSSPGTDADRRSSLISMQERPVSYASRDEQQEERHDAVRALQLAETLARLEDTDITDAQRPVAL